MFLRRKSSQEFGRTMIEMISVLLIMGVISAVAMMWWSKAINTQKANAILEEIGKRASLAQADDGSRPSKFVTNLYDNKNYTKMNYGFGVSAPEFVDDGGHRRAQIKVGALKGDDYPIPESACKILLQRQGQMVAENSDGSAYQTGNVVGRWELCKSITSDGCEKAEDCAEQTIMIAWMNKIAAQNSFVAGGVVAEPSPSSSSTSGACNDHSDCGENKECISGLCKPCRTDWYHPDGENNPCYQTYDLIVRLEKLTDWDKQCSYEGEGYTIENKDDGTPCGVYGECVRNGRRISRCTNLCARWPAAANRPENECYTCDATTGQRDPKVRHGTPCGGDKGICLDGTCTMGPWGTIWVPGLEENGGGWVCDNDNGYTQQGSVCVCKAGWYKNENENKCEQCPVGFYKATEGNDSQCLPCPANSGTSGPGSTECMCSAGYGGDAATSSCTACGIGSYKETVGNGECTSCPANSTTENQGSTSRNVCMCNAGYGGNAATGSCTACASGTYKTGVGNDPCSSCTVANSVLSGTTCVCKAGYYGDGSTGTCTKCADGTYKANDGNGGSCTVCPQGKYRAGDDPPSACISCPSNSTTDGTGKKSRNDCACNAGYYGDARTGNCTACPANYYKTSVGNTSECTACPANSITSGTGKTARSNCGCKIGYGGNAATGSCTKCDATHYKPHSGNSACLACSSSLSKLKPHASADRSTCYQCNTAADCQDDDHPTASTTFCKGKYQQVVDVSANGLPATWPVQSFRLASGASTTSKNLLRGLVHCSSHRCSSNYWATKPAIPKCRSGQDFGQVIDSNGKEGRICWCTTNPG